MKTTTKTVTRPVLKFGGYKITQLLIDSSSKKADRKLYLENPDGNFETLLVHNSMKPIFDLWNPSHFQGIVEHTFTLAAIARTSISLEKFKEHYRKRQYCQTTDGELEADFNQARDNYEKVINVSDISIFNLFCPPLVSAALDRKVAYE